MKRRADLVSIGVITSAHGIRGQVKIRHFLDDPKAVLSKAAISNADGSKQYLLAVSSANESTLIASIRGIKDRNEAELLKGTELYISKSALPQTDDGSWYYNDLVGLFAKMENGENYGKIIAVHNFGAGDIIEIKKVSGELEMLPFNEIFIGEVNVKGGFLTVIPPEYLEADNQND